MDNVFTSDLAAAEATDDSAIATPAFSTRIQAEADPADGSVILGHNTGTTDPVVVSASTADPANVANAAAADGDAYVDFVGDTGQFIEFKVTVPADGWYDLDFGYALGTGNRPMRLDVNGVLFDRMFDLRSTEGFAAFKEQTTRVQLKAGVENTIRLTSNGFSGPNVDYLDVRAADPMKWVFQAEDLVTNLPKLDNTDPLTNRAISPTTIPGNEQFRTGAEGESYLDWAFTSSSTNAARVRAQVADFTFDAPVAGVYSVTLTYASSNARPLDLKLVGMDGATTRVAGFAIKATPPPAKLPDDRMDLLGAGDNHDTATEINGAAPTAFEGWMQETVKIDLPAGMTTVRLQLPANGGLTGPNIDKIEVALVGATPTDIAVDDLSVIENADGAVVGAVTVTDADSSAHTFQVLEGGLLSTRFEVAGGNLRLIAGQSLDFEAAQSFPITVTATDEGGSVSRDFTVTVANDTADDAVPNSAPTGLTLTGSVAENAAGALVGTLSATDADGDQLTYSTNDARFVIVGSELRLADGVSLDYETDDGDPVAVTVSDGTASTNSNVLLSVTDVNEAPTLVVQQAEDGVVITDDGSNTAVRDADHPENNSNLPTGLRPDFTGTGYVDMGAETDRVTYQIPVAEAGNYDLHIRYASNTARPMNLAVNGQSAGQFAFAATGTTVSGPAEGFNNWDVDTRTVQLEAGINTISLANNNGFGPNLDAFAITAVGGTPDFAIPGITSKALDSVVEGATGAVHDVNATGAGTLVYALTGKGADDALFAIDAATGALSFTTAPDFERPADQGANNVYQVEVGVSNGQNTALQALTVTVTNDTSDDNQAPVITTSALNADENKTSAGAITATDADNDTLAFSLTLNTATDNDLFDIDAATGALSFKTAPDFEALGADTEFSVEVAVTDDVATTTKVVTVTVADVAEGGPVAVSFDGAITSYSTQDRPQDGGTGFAVSADNSALALDGNLWKRVALADAYEITDSTKLVLDIQVGTGAEAPEIVAIGFDLNNNPFDGEATHYQLGGTQSQGGFVDLRGTGTPNGDGTTRFVIDLGAHATKSISSLVFINDDDSLASLGSSAFSNVQLMEEAPAENHAPAVVGGGVANRTVSESGSIEIDLPFEDADNDTLTYEFVVRNSSGEVVTDVGNLAIVDGILSGEVATLGNGVFTVAITASDETSSATDEFTLTVEDVNEAPVAQDAALEPYFGKLGASFDGVDIESFRTLFSDPNGDELTLSIEDLPAGLSLNSEGVIVGKPTVAGSFAVTVRAIDGGGLSGTIELQFEIEDAAIGDVVSVEAEAFTGLAAASGFFATGTTAASGQQVILLNQGATGTITTDLSANGLPNGYYKVTAYVFDETDGESTFSLKVGETALLANGSANVVLNDAGAGEFVNEGSPRGNAAHAGNLKAIAFDTVVRVEAGTVATLAGQAFGGEFLRIDRLEFARVAAPNAAPTAITLTGSVDENEAGALVGVLTATDADGDAITFSTTDPRFVIAANATTGAIELRLAADVSLDREAVAEGKVVVTATDARGGISTAELSLNINDLNEAPTLTVGATIATQTFEAGTGGEVDLAGLGATDPDSGDSAGLVVELAGGGALPDGIVLNGSALSVGAGVAAGTYELKVFASDGILDSESVFFTVTVEEPGAEEPFEPITIQAESGTIALAKVPDADSTQIRDPQHPESNPNLSTGLRPGFTGAGYLDFGNDAGDRVSYPVTVAEAGTYDFAIRYATNTARPLDFAVNGGPAVKLPFAATDPDGSGPIEGFDNWLVQTVSVQLNAGENTFSLAIPAGATTGPNLDAIEITRPSATDTSADEDNNLFLSGPDGVLTGANKESINFNIAGRDADIVKVEVSFDGGATRVTVLPDADGDFVVNGSALQPGTYDATIFVTDEAGNVANESMEIEIGGDGVTVEPFTIQAEDETQVTVNDSGTGNTDTSLTREVNATNPDAFGNYRAGATGDAYIDFGTNPGDAITFNVNAPAAGTYNVTFRYANGGDANRPLNLTLNNGTAVSVDFVPGPVTGTGATATAWTSWVEKTVELNLVAGANTIKLAVPTGAANGPNIDQATFTYQGGDGEPVDTREQVRFEEVIKINFEPAPTQTSFSLPAGYQTPAGYSADTGAAYADRGNGFTYGWVDVENGAVTSNPLAQPTGSMRYKNDVAGASNLQKTYAHFEYPGVSATDNERAWEMALANGTYQVTMSIGDTGGAYDSTNVINVEGQSFFPGFTPENLEGGSPVGSAYNSIEDGEGFRSTLVTGIVQVTDGKLTIDSIGGYNTEIQHLEVERVPDLTPADGRTADLDFSMFAAPMAASIDGQVSIAIGENGSLPTGIDPSASFVVGVQLQATGNRGPNIAHVENVKLVETLTGIEVDVDVQISGGADSLTIRPLQELKENTSYTLKVQDVLDLGSISDPDGALRQFQDLTTTFVTGEAVEDVAREVAFTTTTLLDGFADGAGGFTTVEFGPDGKLYVATIMGQIHRWDVNSDGTIDKASQETLTLDYLASGLEDRRGIVGFVFDPEDPNTIWITDNAPIPREAKAFETPEFSGRVSKITLGAGGSFEGVTAEAYITGLPRSGGDHLTNSLEFRPNPNAGQAGEPDHLLYLTQGSNSAAGAADGAWGNRPERLLNAAILEIDPTRDAPAGGFDVRTEPIDSNDAPTTTFPAANFNADGTYPGSYNPFAADAVLKIYATGVRNAYDLVWHSNGNLYVPTNGTASGGKTPNDPTQPGLDTVIGNSPKQYDYFFTIDEGGYYGHPNPLRDEYILNGGNPTSGLDPNEVVGGNDGNSNTDGYQTGVQPDGGYDLNGVYNLGYNRSPNGATEYTGDAFGSNLKGAILFAQFSTGDNVRAIRVDADGKIIGDDVLRRPDGSVINNYIDPLDIIENPVTGQLYLMTLNRGTGASQLILLTPAPGGVTSDVTADEGGNLALVAFDVSDPAASVFQVNGLDSDITAIRVSFNGGPETTVTLDAQKRFTVDVGSTAAGPVTARIRVTDDALNQAMATTAFTPGEQPQTGELIPLVTIQAEDNSPTDGTSVSIATGTGAEIQIRTTANPETGTSGLVGGLRPGAFGLDGNTNNADAVAGGYADFGASNADFITFNFTVGADQAGTGMLKVRYGNGGTADRPLEVFVNGVSIGEHSFTPPAGVTGDAAWSTWKSVDIPANLIAGVNTVTFKSVDAIGPNIDQLEVLVPSAPFDPDYVAISGDTRIELEQTANNSTRVLNNQTVEFYFKAGADGLHVFDLAANAGAPNGGGLKLFLNGVAVEELAFPGAGTAGEQNAFVQLEAGKEYQLRVVSDAPGANAIDYLDVRPVAGNANADIAIQSLDPAYLDNRLHFSHIENPTAVNSTEPRDMKDSGTVRITNTGTQSLSVMDFELEGPFVLANPAVFNGLSLAAGQSIDVTVLFNRAAYTPPTTNVDGTSTTFNGSLKLITNDAENPISTIDLAGFWQARDEGGQEPNVNEIWKTFGFGNVIEGLKLTGGGENSVLSTKDVFAQTDATEVLSPYWQLADGVTQAKITQIAAFHGPGGASVGIHNPGNKGAGVTFWNHEGTDNQRLLPNSGNDTTFSTKTFGRGDIPDGWVGADAFGINVAGLSTDPRLNPRGDEEVPGAQQGHTVKMFQALDADGNVIPNVYLGIMDYTGINYDYNDNLFVIEGVKPVGFGQSMVIAGLDAAAADDRLVFTNIENPANTSQVFRNEATFTITNDGFSALTITGMDLGNPAAFQIVGNVPTSIAAGASANVTVRFVGTHSGTTAGADLLESTLTIRTNASHQSEKVINLAGLAQEFSENGSEPTVAQIVEAFGYSTDMAQAELSGGGAVETIGDEVLMPYLQKLDGSAAVEIIQIGAFLQQGNVARLGFHGLNSSQVTNLMANDDQQGQTVLPDGLVAGGGSGATVARGTITQDGPFGLYVSVDGRPTFSSWSDPEANEIDPNIGPLVDNNEGHLIRFFKALDAAGNVIEGTYIGIQDYPGAGNYDYNDHMFVIKNVKAYELTAANDANNNDVNDALELDGDNDSTVNFFDSSNTNPTGPQQPFTGTAPSFTAGKLTVDASNYDTGGQTVAYNDNAGKEGGNTGFRSGDAVETVGTENDIGYVRAGEWVEYTVNVPASGVYNLSLLAKTPSANASVAVSLAGGATLANVALQDGGSSFGTAPFQASAPVAITLPSGQQTIRLTFNGTGDAGSPYLLDLRSFSLEQQVQQPVTQTPFGGTAPATVNGTLVVDASNYDNGGQGIAYNDAAGLQGGTNGGRTGSAVEATGGGDIGWIANGEWLEYTINVGQAGTYDLSFLAALGQQGSPAIVASFEQGGAVYETAAPVSVAPTGSWSTFSDTATTRVDLKAGVQTVRVAFNGSLDLRSFELDLVDAPPPPAQAAFNTGSTPWQVGSNGLTLAASLFDSGGQGVAFNDTTAADLGGTAGRNEAVDIVGNNSAIGWIENGEWVEYTINVAQAGDYRLTFNTATPEGGRSIVASFATGSDTYLTTSAIGVPDVNSYTAFTDTQAVTVKLAAGQQVMRVLMNGGSMDMKSFTLAPTGPQQNAFGGEPRVVDADGLIVNAALFDTGGEGVAYHDTTTADLGGTGGRNEGVDIVGNNSAIGWVENGEWVEYTIDVGAAGSYDLSFVSALASGSGRSISASFSQAGAVYETASIGVPSTGSWSTFDKTSAAEVDLKAGVQVVRLSFSGGSMDLRSFELVPSEAGTAAASTSSMSSTETSGSGLSALLADIFQIGTTATETSNIVEGGSGSDRLFGTPGSDVLIGDGGNDWLFGGEGSDVFAFGNRDGRDRVMDFKNGTDHFDLAQVTRVDDFDDVSVKRSAGGVTVDYDTGSFLVVGASINDIDASDFSFRDRDTLG